MRSHRLTPRGSAAEGFLAARGLPLVPSAANPRLPEPLAPAVAGYDVDDGLLWEVWELLRCAPEMDPPRQRAAAFLLAAVLLGARRGSTRLPLEPPAVLEGLLGYLGADKGDRVAVRALLSVDPKARGAAGPLLGGPGEFKPLVLDRGCVYLQRLWEFERRLAELLERRLRLEPGPLDAIPAALADLRARPAHAGGVALSLSGEQERAVVAALHLPLTVVTGGPGTGKTSIVVSVLRALLRLGVPVESIALAAPTGKAANRMEQSIKQALASVQPLEEPDSTLLQRCPAPRTLHRLLGYSPSHDRFRHHENNPLAERVIILDESSMVDLFLMDRLVRAVDPSRSRLVLLGDADQLPSVEAGAVFRDLVAPVGAAAPKPWDAVVHAPLPPPGPAAPEDPRAACTVRLSRSYRQDERATEGRQILEVAEALRDGRVEELFASLPRRDAPADVAFQGVEWVPSASAADREALLDRWFDARVRSLPGLDGLLAETWILGEAGELPPEQRPRLEELVRHFERSRVLCVTRGDARPTGAAAVNDALRSRWHLSRGIPADAAGPRFALGEPVMAERNDYERGLFNGDQGLVLRVRGPNGAGTRAVFSRREGLVAHPADAESGLSRCFAMTVHKAQGSEYDAVLLVLPDERLPILTREVLYTAVTRARRSVVIVGPREVLAAGVATPLVRHSGVGERLLPQAVPRTTRARRARG